jgi:ClpP class serine protease
MKRTVIDWIYDHRWAITPNALETIIQIASRENVLENVEAHYDQNYKVFHGVEPQAIQAVQGEPLAGARSATLRGNVAIIPVLGPIFPRSNLFTSFSGATSIETLSKDLRVALDSDEVESIVLNIDSPGGEITGVSEFSDMLYDARNKKRILSYVYGMGASAAYWMGSSASEMVMSATAEVGSIGVVAAYRDTSERDAKLGIKSIEIVSSVSPNKRPDVATAEGHAQIQRIVDELADIFVASVARNRDTGTDDVLSNFGKGGMLVGTKAVEAGLADGVSSLEAVIDTENGKTQTQTGGFFMKLTAEQVKADHPEAYAAIHASGVASVVQTGASDTELQTARAQGANEERERIRGIHALEAPGHEAIVAAEMFTPEANADSVATKVLAAQAENRKKTGENQQADGQELAGKISGLGQEQPKGSAETDKVEEDATVSAMVAGADSKVK